MKVAVFGSGYVGLVQAAVLAEVGHQVICIDVDGDKITRLQRGEISIYEPGLDALVAKGMARKLLRFSTDADIAIDHAEIIFIAVGTPANTDGSAQLQYVLDVAQRIAKRIAQWRIVINKSTVPVGTAAKVRSMMAKTLQMRGLEVDFAVVSNPEFLKEGSAVADCRYPDRIILGTDDSRAETALRTLYAPFDCKNIMVMDVRSAELAKYAANCMLATKISFINEIAHIAEHCGADIEQVRRGISADPRIGSHFIHAGCGYGGSCFPKDIRALLHMAHEHDFEASLITAVDKVNQRQKQVLFDKIQAHFRILKNRCFALWGLAFKPNTNDLREAVSGVLIRALLRAGALVRAYDPQAMEAAKQMYNGCQGLFLCATQEEALEGADALVVCTEWKCFQSPDWETLHQQLKYQVVFDGRNIYDPLQVRRQGLCYYGIGRGSQSAK